MKHVIYDEINETHLNQRVYISSLEIIGYITGKCPAGIHFSLIGRNVFCYCHFATCKCRYSENKRVLSKENKSNEFIILETEEDRILIELGFSL